MSSTDDAPAAPLTELPAHVTLQILARLSARDLASLSATCRAFGLDPGSSSCDHRGLTLVDAAAKERVGRRAPWMGAPRARESWLSLMRFAERSAEIGLPMICAAEDATAVVARDGRLHVWGPVVDDGGWDDDDDDDGGGGGGGGGGGDDGRVLTAACGYAFNAAAGESSAPLVVRRNAAGVAHRSGGGGAPGPGGGASRPPPSPAARDAAAGAGAGAGSQYSPGGDIPGGGIDISLARLTRIPKRGAFDGERVVSMSIGRLHVIACTSTGVTYTWGGDAAGQLGRGVVRESVALARLALGGSPGVSPGVLSASMQRRRRRGGSGGAGGGYGSPGAGSPRCASPLSWSGGDCDERDAAARRAEEKRQWTRPRRVRDLAGHVVIGVAAGAHASAAFTSSGALFTWGDNRSSMLGLGDDLDRDAPCRVASFGGGGGRRAARMNDATRFPGAMSDTDDSDEERDAEEEAEARRRRGGGWDIARNDPRDFLRASADSALSGGTSVDDDDPGARVVAVSFGARHAVAVTADGVAHTWGGNAHAQLGTEDGPSQTPRPWPAPVDLEDAVESGSDVDDVDGFDDDDLDLDDEELLFAQDGDASFDAPGPTTSPGGPGARRRARRRGCSRTFVVAAAAGGKHTALTTARGAVVVFGGGLGVGDAGHQGANAGGWTPPTRVRGLPMSASSVAAGREHTVVLTREGDVYAWGDDGVGQLGGGERSSDAADAFARPTPAKVASFPRG